MKTIHFVCTHPSRVKWVWARACIAYVYLNVIIESVWWKNHEMSKCGSDCRSQLSFSICFDYFVSMHTNDILSKCLFVVGFGVRHVALTNVNLIIIDEYFFLSFVYYFCFLFLLLWLFGKMSMSFSFASVASFNEYRVWMQFRMQLQRIVPLLKWLFEMCLTLNRIC